MAERLLPSEMDSAPSPAPSGAGDLPSYDAMGNPTGAGVSGEYRPAKLLPSEMDDGKSGSAGSLVASPFVGFNRGLADVAGAPVDFTNWALGKAGLPVSERPFGGSESIKRGLGVIGANPDEHLPRNTLEKVLQSGGEGAAAAIAPEGIVQGGARALGSTLGELLPRAGKYIEPLIGSGSSTSATATNAVASGVGSMVGDTASSVAPEPYKPVVNMVGNVIGAGSTGLAGVGARTAKDVLAPKVSEFFDPFTAAGRERYAARTWESGLSDPYAVRNALEDAAETRAASGNPNSALGEIVPGSKPTTGQLTGDLGLLSTERGLVTNAPEDFKSNEWGSGQEAQNAARVNAIHGIQPTGSPENVSGFFRQQLQGIDSTYDALDQAARQLAQQRAAAIGSGASPETVGTNLRDALATKLAQVRKSEKALWDAVDPNENMVLPGSSVADTAKSILGKMTEGSRPLSDEEARIFRVASGLGDDTRFQTMRDLRSAISTEMRETPNEQTRGRLTALRGAVESAIDNALENQAAIDARSVGSGEAQAAGTLEANLGNWQSRFGGLEQGRVSNYPEAYAGPASAQEAYDPSLFRAEGEGGISFPASAGDQTLSRGFDARPGLSGFAKGPPDILDAIRQFGGIKDVGGDLRARGLDQQRGIINNRTGLDPDKMRESLAEAGYLGENTDDAMSGTTIRDMMDRIDQNLSGNRVHSVYDELDLGDHANYQNWKNQKEAVLAAQNEIDRNVDRTGGQPVDAATKRNAASIMVNDNVPWDTALERAYSQSQEQVQGQPFGGNRQSFKTVADADRANGSNNQGPIVDERAAQAIKAASKATAEKHATYGQGVVGNVLERGPTKGTYKLLPSLVPERVFPQGAKGAETVQAYLKASGLEGIPLVSNAAAESLRRTAINPDGMLDPVKFNSWQKKYQDALRALPPDLSRQFSDASKAADFVNKVALQRKQDLENYQSDAIKKVIGLHSPEDVTRTVGGIFSSKAPVQQMRSLAQEAAKDPDAKEGLRKAVVDFLSDKAISNAEVGTSGVDAIKSDTFQSFIRKNASVLKEAGFSDGEIDNMRAVAADLKRSQRTLQATRLPGGSNSAQDLSQVLARIENKKADVSMMTKALGALFTGHPIVASGIIGHGTGDILRKSGITQANELVRRAIYDPEFARVLSQKIGPSTSSRSDIRLQNVLFRQGFAAGVKNRAPEPDYNSGANARPLTIHRATGGRAMLTPDELIRRVEQARKSISNETEPLLNMNDDTVAKALAIANNGI